MKLSKKEKIEAYEIVLEALNNETPKGKYIHTLLDSELSSGVCHLLSLWLKSKGKEVCPTLTVNVFDELIKYQYSFYEKNPENITAYWLENTKTRIKVVTEILTELKKQP